MAVVFLWRTNSGYAGGADFTEVRSYTTEFFGFLVIVGDDGEVFKVKKSAQSKKIKKLLDKERKKQKEKPNTTLDSSEKTIQPQLNEDIVIKLKNTFVSSLEF